MKSLLALMLVAAPLSHAAVPDDESISPPPADSGNYCPHSDEPDARSFSIKVPLFPNLANLSAESHHIFPGQRTLHRQLQRRYRDQLFRLHFELCQPFDPAKEILLVLPGGYDGSHAAIHDVANDENLTGKFNVVGLDYRGRHASAFPAWVPPQAYFMRYAAADIEIIRRHLEQRFMARGRSLKINIYGHSSGSALAQTYALSFPKSLNRLVLASPHSAAADILRPDVQQKWLAADPGLDELKVPLKSGLEQAVECLEKAPLRSDLKPGDERFTHLSCRPEHLPRTSCGPEWHWYPEPYDYRAVLPRIKARTMVIGGELDVMADVMREMGKAIPDSFVYIDKDLGHDVAQKWESCIAPLVGAFLIMDADRSELEEIAVGPGCGRS